MERQSSPFGGRTIGFIGGYSMLLNNILGPGIANFPGLYQQTGWLAPSVFIAVCAVGSFLGGEMLVAAIRAMPGNQNFEKRVEFTTLCTHYFPRHIGIFCSVLFQLAMLTANISNIIQTSQVFDQIIDSLFGDSCALEFYPSFARFFCGTSNSDISPFGKDKTLVSFGACLVAALSVPLGYWNLEDNICVQNVAMVLILVSMLIWVSTFVNVGLEGDRVPVVPDDATVSSFHGLFGTILFNFMFISTLPSWVCEKRPSVRSSRVVLLTLVSAGVMFVVLGSGGGMAFATYWNTDNTLMSELHHLKDLHGDRPALWVPADVSVDTYAVASNLASIPIFSIMMRYNLIQAGVLGPRAAGFVAVVLPWLVSVLFYCGDGFKSVVDFSGAFTSSVVNLLLPPLLFIASQRDRGDLLTPQDDSRNMSLVETRARLAALGAESVLPENPNLGSSCAGATEERLAMAVDESGRISGRKWLAIAWVNVGIMTVITVLAMVDQIQQLLPS